MIRLGLIGAGAMGAHHAKQFQAIAGCELVAVCDIDAGRAAAFAAEHDIEGVYSDIGRMLAGADIDAVTVVTPDKFHKDASLAAIAAGKHILCEKPLATNEADASEMAAAANRAGVINMINLSYRDCSALQHARELIAAGRIGRVMHVEASYLQSWLTSNLWGDWRTDPQWLWRLSSEHGSKGVLGDVGIHILDFASYPVGEISAINCRLKCFDKAEGNRIGDYPLDANDSALIRMEFANGALGSVHTSRWATGHRNSLRLRIFGDRGAVTIDIDLHDGWETLSLCEGDNVDPARWVKVEAASTPTIYQRFIRSIETGVNDQPDFHHGARLQRVLDCCFVSDREDRTLSLDTPAPALAASA
ncbi:oxidoreductase [Marinobacterium nitratireducens]|uniref:Oxidoreductase n=1 Tax=Marinobacterium nitratireducens TaxID=518897 RepID=A0A917ZKE7_9GAMM|nr:Gfo/Idh/MocA family oxidoreductase [Marinobacterium nitratireducens]GGO85538.1 oxidoreductase [Marinobacterium nitratireducens]